MCPKNCFIVSLGRVLWNNNSSCLLPISVGKMISLASSSPLIVTLWPLTKGPVPFVIADKSDNVNRVSVLALLPMFLPATGSICVKSPRDVNGPQSCNVVHYGRLSLAPWDRASRGSRGGHRVTGQRWPAHAFACLLWLEVGRQLVASTLDAPARVKPRRGRAPRLTAGNRLHTGLL